MKYIKDLGRPYIPSYIQGPPPLIRHFDLRIKRVGSLEFKVELRLIEYSIE